MQNLTAQFNERSKVLADFVRGDFGESFQKSKHQAWSSLIDQGLPNQRNENWKYTQLKFLNANEFGPSPDVNINELEKNSDFVSALNVSPHRFVFVNGVFVPGLSSGVSGVTFYSLSELLMGMNAQLAELPFSIQKLIGPSTSPMNQMNYSLADDGYVISFDKNTSLEHPIHILSYSTGESNQPWLNAPRNIIFAGEGSQVEVIESCIGETGSRYFYNSSTSVHLEKNARLSFCQRVTQSDSSQHYGSVTVSQDRDSFFESFNLSSGGEWIRNDLNVEVNGEGAETHLNGLFITKDKQHVDNHTEIVHKVPHCLSRQLYKGVLDDKSRGVFNGKINILQDAQKVDSSQLNQNLLLSDKVEIDSKPELEVAADDVKANHGSASGPLEANELFYFQSRAIDRDQAIKMISAGFAMDVVYKHSAKSSREYIFAQLATLGWAGL